MRSTHSWPASGLALVALLTGVVSGQEDITVLVIHENGLAAVDGATVTLQGTDPASLPGLVGTTGPGGTVTFPSVSGPYSVTAQADVVSGGTTTRLATSLIDVSPAVSGSPPSGTIGILLVEDLDDDPPPADATLSGTIANLPSLTGGEIVEVVAVEDHTGHFLAWANGSSGSYAMAIPSNVALHCYAAHRKGYGSSEVIATLIRPAAGSATPGGTLTEDFDFADPQVVSWSVPVSVTASNAQPGFQMGLQLLVRDASTGVDLDFSIFDGSPGPVATQLPDVTDPSLAGYWIGFEADAFDPLEVLPGDQSCLKVLSTTPGAVAFDFMPLPAMIDPVDGVTVTLPELECLTGMFAESNPGSIGSNGVNLFFLGSEHDYSGTAPPGIDQAEWAVFLPSGTQVFDLPRAALPMFASGQTIFCGVEQWRLKGFTMGYAGFFDGNLAANVTNLESSLTEDCASEASGEITVISDTYCTAGTSASGCRASLQAFGTASASAPSGFVLAAVFVEGNKDGLFFFGPNGRQALPWGNGTSFQCVVPPVKRAGLLLGIGTPGLCDGTLAQDLNAHWCPTCPKWKHAPAPGAVVQAQLWYRDPANTSNQSTSFSNAVEFCVQP